MPSPENVGFSACSGDLVKIYFLGSSEYTLSYGVGKLFTVL